MNPSNPRSEGGTVDENVTRSRKDCGRRRYRYNEKQRETFGGRSKQNRMGDWSELLSPTLGNIIFQWLTMSLAYNGGNQSSGVRQKSGFNSIDQKYSNRKQYLGFL